MAVKVDEVARALNLTPRRVQQLKEEGLPTVGRGQYELGPCMAWYIRYLQGKLEKMGPNMNSDTPDLVAERTRLAKEQGDKLAIENSIKRSELVYVSDVVSAWSEHISNARAKLLSLPSKVAPQLVNQPNANVIASKLREDIDTLLYELAEGHDQYLASVESGSEDMEAAAEVDDIGMVGQVPKTQ